MLERRLRLYTGLILAAYVISHFVNHSLGLLSVDAMEAYRRINALVWQNPVGTVALYGAFIVHGSLALCSLFRRTTLRMPWWEAMQLRRRQVLSAGVSSLSAMGSRGMRRRK